MFSVIIIAKDAQKFIQSAIISAQAVSDDVVVVVDEASKDKTEQIATKMQCRIFPHPHIGIVEPMRKMAVTKAKYEWVMFLDADEEISPKLGKEILQTIPSTQMAAFKIPRLNYIFGKPINHTNWGPEDDSHIWLFKKSLTDWKGEIHEELQVNGTVGQMKGLKIHHNYSTVEEFMGRLNSYTSREKKPTNPISDFLRRYIWHKGFLDGWHGLFLSYLMMIYHLSTQIKLWEKKNLSSFPS